MKKVLSLVLALVMVLGSFSFVAAADFSDVNGTNNGEAITRLSELNLLKGYPDGTFKPENQITRAEFAAVMVRAKGLEAVAETTKGLPTGFNDVAGFHWASGYVGTASKAGIVNGIGNGLFAPEAPVKYEDAITMVVRALGYEASAQTKGGYPYGYLIVASELDLLEDARGTQGLPATRAFVAQITDNALEVPMMVQVGFGSDAKWVVSGSKEHGDDAQERYLLDEMGFDFVEGRVEDYNDSRNTIKIGRDNYDVEAGFDFYEVEGVEIKAWLDGDEVIVYTLEEEVLFDAVKYDESADELELIGADDEYDVDKDAELYVDEDEEDEDFTADYAKVVLNDEGDVIRVFAYNYTDVFVVEEVEDEVALDVEDNELDLEDYTLVKGGKTLAIEDLEAGDVILYNANEEFAVVYNNSLEGVIDRAYTNSFRLDGKTYDLAKVAYYLDGEEIDTVTTDTLADFEEEEEEVEIFFDFAGDVVLIVGTRGNATSTMGAILTEDAASYSSRNKTYVAVDAINENDEKVSFDADEDVDFVNAAGAEITAAKKADKLDVIEYKVDEDGDLKEVKVLAEVAGAEPELKIDARYAHGKRLQSSTVVFLLDGTKVDEVFTWADADDYFEKATAYKVYANADERVTYLVIEASDADTSENEIGFVTKMKVLADGDVELTINIDGKAYEFIVESVGAGVEAKKFVDFDINNDMDEIDNVVLLSPDFTGAISEISSRNKTFKVGSTTYELASDAVVFDITGSTKTISINDIDNGDTVFGIRDEGTGRFVKYLVRADEATVPGDVETAEGVVTYIDTTVVEVDDVVYTLAAGTVLRNEVGVIEFTGGATIGNGTNLPMGAQVFDIVANADNRISSFKYVAAAADRTAAKAVIDEINELDAEAVTFAADVTAARGSYTGLSGTRQNLVTNLADLVAAENQVAANVVILLLDADELDPEHANFDNAGEVAAARVAYDGLTADEQALVTNYNKLEAAEAALLQAAADVVIALLDADELDPEHANFDNAGEVAAARAAYDGLTADEQALVTNYNKLVLAEATIDVAADKASLAIGFDAGAGDTANDVTTDLTLAAAGASTNTTITWSSSNTALVANDGTVTQPNGANVQVTLTATITSDDDASVVDTKTFVVTVTGL